MINKGSNCYFSKKKWMLYVGHKIFLSQYYTGIIPFSRLGVFYANLGSAEIFFANRKRGPQNKWQLNILKHTSVPNVGIVDILNGFSVSTCK